MNEIKERKASNIGGFWLIESEASGNCNGNSITDFVHLKDQDGWGVF